MQINFKINPLKIILLVVKLKMLYICIYNYLCIYLFNLWLRRTAEKYFMVKQQRRQINREEKKGNFIGILYLSIYSFYLSTYFYLYPSAVSPFHLAFYLYFFLSIHVSVQNSFSNSI